MQFGEKIKAAREAAGLTQEQLGQMVGVSRKSIAYYESNTRRPKAEMIVKLANALKVGVNYFISEEDLAKMTQTETFIDEAKKQFGMRGKAQAKYLLDQTSALFAGGELDEEDEEEFFKTITQIYFDAKNKAKKYTPKKYEK